MAQALLQEFEQCFEAAFAKAVAAGDLGRSPNPAARARIAGSLLDTLAIRARIGIPPSKLKAFAASMVPAICG